MSFILLHQKSRTVRRKHKISTKYTFYFVRPLDAAQTNVEARVENNQTKQAISKNIVDAGKKKFFLLTVKHDIVEVFFFVRKSTVSYSV